MFCFEKIYNKVVFLLLISSIATLLTCLMNIRMPSEDDTLLKYSAISGSIGLLLSSIYCCYICKREYSHSNNNQINLSDDHPIHNEDVICEVVVDEKKQMHPELAIAIYIQREDHPTLSYR